MQSLDRDSTSLFYLSIAIESSYGERHVWVSVSTSVGLDMLLEARSLLFWILARRFCILNRMKDIMLIDVVIRFILGGSAIVASTIFARKIGGTVGGIFAAFPAVYLAALIAAALDNSVRNLIPVSITLSYGALIGMLANIITAAVATYAILRAGWKLGLVISLFTWASLSATAALLIQNV